MSSISDNLAHVRARIADACARAGRDPGSVTLIAVSKGKPPAMLVEAARHGVQHFGENRVEEAEVKIPAVRAALGDTAVRAPLAWHMIGHVQSRKAKQVAPLLDVIHSLDSVRLAQKFSRLAVESGATLTALLQMNVSGEASKEGFDAAGWAASAGIRDQVRRAAAEIIALPGLRVVGLMTIAPYVEDAEAVRPVFSELRRLRDDLATALGVPLPELSMGMTDDYPVAVEEGATLVRIGRAIFGER
jgi:hypothetical protein